MSTELMLDVRVYGSPAPQGSKRHVGGGRMIESSKNVTPWREAVKAAVLAQRGVGPILVGPLLVTVEFALAKPKSAAKNARPAKRPDIDKLLRSTFDALGDAGVWRDDSQVIGVEAIKTYAGDDPTGLLAPGARICVEAVS